MFIQVVSDFVSGFLDKQIPYRGIMQQPDDYSCENSYPAVCVLNKEIYKENFKEICRVHFQIKAIIVDLRISITKEGRNFVRKESA